METLGIENLKKFLKNLFKATVTAINVFADGKVSFPGEYWELGTSGFNIFGAVKVAPVALKELKDLDAGEKAEVLEYIKDEFDIPNDVVEAHIESALDKLITGGELLWEAGLEIKAIIEGLKG